MVASLYVLDALEVYREARKLARAIRWPSARYRSDPVGFFRDILGIEPWSTQREVLESVRDNPRTTWKSGHRVSKSNTASGCGLWFYSSFDDARVVMSAPVARQVDDILWRETAMMKKRGGVCLACRAEGVTERPCPHSALIDGKLGKRAATGLVSDNFREIKGYTAKDVEAITGTAGKNLFFVFDECSGIPDEIFEGLEGNRAGWASDGPGTVRVLYTGNPTKTSGEFYESHNGKSKYFHCITTSSEDTPNCREGRVVVPGLATKEWVDEKKEMWGEESALYLIRVKGEFAEREDGKIFSVAAIVDAESRWADTKAEGRLFVGLDPAGESGTGDEAVFAPRRGQKLLELVAFTGLSPAAHLVHALGIVERLGRRREKPVIVLDREGAVGAKVYGEFLRFLEERKGEEPFELVAVRASDRAVRQPHVFDRMRDELTANLEGWMREGGAIPEDSKLAAELHVWEWEQQAHTGRLKLVPQKKVLRRRDQLGRSPDRYDALALACWVPLSLRDGVPPSARRGPEPAEELAEHAFDPYAGADAWRRR